MFDFHEKRKIRSLIYSKFSIGIVVVLIVLLSMSVFERFSVEREMKERRMAEEEELQLLQERADALEEKVEHLQNTRGIEEELRNRFDVAREGEQVVIIVDDEDGREPSLDDLSQPPGSSNDDGGWYFLDFFKFW